MHISAWESQVRLSSPDGKHVAEISEAHEFAQGSPVSGELLVDGRSILKACGTSLAWSSDSRFLAIPIWKFGWLGNRKGQKLVVLDIATGKTINCDEKFRVIEIHRFEGSVVSGIDSPSHQPRHFTWQVFSK